MLVFKLNFLEVIKKNILQKAKIKRSVLDKRSVLLYNKRGIIREYLKYAERKRIGALKKFD